MSPTGWEFVSILPNLRQSEYRSCTLWGTALRWLNRLLLMEKILECGIDETATDPSLQHAGKGALLRAGPPKLCFTRG